MTPGYVSLLFFFIMCILMATDWKPLIAPAIRSGHAFIFLVAVGCALLFPLWIAPFDGYPQVRIHAAACLLLAVAVKWSLGVKGLRSYMFFCSLMLGIVWGTARSLYSYESMFYWLSPTWDAPLLGGLLCGAFASDVKQQLGLIGLGAAVEEIVAATFREGSLRIDIGALYWWDGVSIALASAIAITLVMKAIRRTLIKLGASWLGLKGGGSS